MLLLTVELPIGVPGAGEPHRPQVEHRLGAQTACRAKVGLPKTET